MKELHAMSAFVHGALVALHGLGIIYNLKRKNRWDVVAHAAALAYSLQATTHHIKESRGN